MANRASWRSLAESFNLFNHQNVTEIETTGYIIEPGTPASELGAPATPPTLNFLTGLKTNSKTGLPNPALLQPLNINATDFYREAPESALALVVSGGHTNLFLAQPTNGVWSTPSSAAPSTTQPTAFVKIAKLLGLGYPGGLHGSTRSPSPATRCRPVLLRAD